MCIFSCLSVHCSSFCFFFLPLPIYSLTILHRTTIQQPSDSFLLFSIYPHMSFPHQFPSSPGIPLDILPSLSVNHDLPSPLEIHPPFSHCFFLFHLSYFFLLHCSSFSFPNRNPSLSILHTCPIPRASSPHYLSYCECMREERATRLTAAPVGVYVCSGV